MGDWRVGMARGFRIKGVIFAVIALAVSAAMIAAGVTGCNDDAEESPVHIEEFRVAEPLTMDPESALRNRLETITAVTEPFDEVEAAVEDESEEVARSPAALEDQCVTVLKEMAFCTNEDAFLDIIGTASNLRTSGERERFMDRVQQWYEPGGTRSACERLLEEDEAVSSDEAREMWQQAAASSEKLCTEFGDALLEANTFGWIGAFWKE